MIPTTKFAVSSVQVSQLPIGCDQIEGIYNGAAAAWLQVHDSCIAPATGAVPLYQLPLNPATQFQETLQVANLTLTEGLFIGVSSTEGTYTASASVMDITVWTDVAPLATNVVGDKSTDVIGLQVWASPNPNKKLYGVILQETSNITNYVYISVNGIASALYGNQGFIFTLAPKQIKKFYFGVNEGLTPFFVDVNNVFGTQGALITGCTILLSTAVIQNGQFATQAGINTTVLAITN